MSVARGVGGLAILGVLLALLLLAVRFERKRSLEGEEHGSTASGGQGDSRRPGAERLGAQSDGRERVGPEAEVLLHGRVTSVAGDPLSGSLVRWIALQKEDLEPNPAWP